jgi:hypothetical protein
MDINLRVDIQNRLFGSVAVKNKIPVANQKYYHYCFDNSLLHCENCGKPLYVGRNIDGCYSAYNVSHILTKGAHPDMAHDPRNHNILCVNCHEQWENGEKRGMLIYLDNRVVIKELKKDYNIK